MKIAVSSEGPGLDSMVDPRFGRAAGFVLVDTDSMAAEYLTMEPRRFWLRARALKPPSAWPGPGYGPC